MRTTDDAEGSKPDPDVLETALEKLALPPEAALLIGDTLYDVHAAAPLPLGLGVMALRCAGWGDKDLASALAIYDEPQDLLANYKTSPFAREGSRMK